MFTSVSMTGIGIAAYFLTQFLQWIGFVNFDTTQSTTIIKEAIDVISFILMIWGQARRKDITGFFFRTQ